MKNKTLLYLSGRFFDGISSGMFMMALPWIMLADEGMGTFVAIIALVCTITSFLLTPILSALIDRYSRKAILVIVQIIQATTALLILFSFLIELPSFWLLALAQWVFWLSNDLAWSTNNAFTQENYTRGEYSRITGHQEVVMQLTMLGAGGAGIILLAQWSMLEFSLLAFIASSLSALSYAMTPYQRKLSATEAQQPFSRQLIETKHIFARQPRFYLFLALSCLSYPVMTFLVKLVPIHFAEQAISGAWFAGWKISYGFGALLCGFVVAGLLNRIAYEHAMIVSMTAMSVLLILIALFLSPLVMVLLTVTIGFFNALNRIARTNKMNHEVAVSQRGRIEGGLKLFSTFSQSASYVLIALLSHLNLTAYGFITIALILLFASLLMVNLYRDGAHIDTQIAAMGTT